MSQAGSSGGGSVTIPVTVPQGGTGEVSLTANGVLVGEGINPIHVTAVGSAGQVLTSNGTGLDPTFQSVSGLLYGITNLGTPFITALGYHACNLTTGVDNTAIGWEALNQVTTGADNTAVGFLAGTNYTGAESGNIVIGAGTNGTTGESYVTRIGKAGSQTACYIDGINGFTPSLTAQVAIVDTEGQCGTLTSGTAGWVLTSNGASNPSFQAGLIGITETLTPFTTALGYGANQTATGVNNTSIGWNALAVGTTAHDCTAIGYNALSSAVAMVGNTAVGSQALQHANATPPAGDYNTGIGNAALYSLTTGQACTACGCYSQYTNNAGNGNTSLGYSAAYTTVGSNNVAVGNSALKLGATGTGNTCIGYSAGSAFTSTEGGNIDIGFNQTGVIGDSYVTRIGTGMSQCFISGITGVTPAATAKMTITDSNGQLGTISSGSAGQVLVSNGVGSTPSFQAAAGGLLGITETLTPYITALGYLACNTTTGINNTGIGWSSLQSLTTGIDNTCLGFYSGANYTSSESNNICIGFDVHGTTAESNTIRIGKHGTYTAVYVDGINGTATASTGLVTVTDANGQIGTIASGSANYVLTSNGAATPTFQALPGKIGTINGDTGSVTGATISLLGNTQCGSTVKFSGSGATMTMNLSDSFANTILGYNSGNATFTGNQNTSIGQTNLLALTSGSNNVALGMGVMPILTTGTSNFSAGYQSSSSLTTGTYNTSAGDSSLENLSTGSYNACYGASAGSGLTGSDSNNIFLGNTGISGDSNLIRIGTQGSGTAQQNKCFIAGISGVTPGTAKMVIIDNSTGQVGTITSGSTGAILTSGGSGATPSFVAFPLAGATNSSNTVYGTSAAPSIAGSGSVAIGYSAMGAASSAATDVAVGHQALANVTSATKLVALGYQAMQAVTTGNLGLAIGYQAGYRLTNPNSTCIVGPTAGQALTTGTGAHIFGYAAGYAIQTGATDLTAIGQYAFHAGTTQVGVTAVGYYSCNAASNISGTTALGASTLMQNTTGSYNTAIGWQSQYRVTSGANNTTVGWSSGGSNANGGITTGTDNTLLGYNTGTNYRSSESNNILIGSAVTGTLGESGVTRIGVQGTQTACYVAGIDGVTITGAAVLCSATGQLGDVVSAKRFKDNIRDIADASSPMMLLQPRQFNYKSDPENTNCYGLVAEEVWPLMPDLCTFDKNKNIYSVKYHEMPAMLLNELQKLAARVAALEAQLGIKSPVIAVPELRPLPALIPDEPVAPAPEPVVDDNSFIPDQGE